MFGAIVDIEGETRVEGPKAKAFCLHL